MQKENNYMIKSLSKLSYNNPKIKMLHKTNKQATVHNNTLPLI